MHTFYFKPWLRSHFPFISNLGFGAEPRIMKQENGVGPSAARCAGGQKI
jgi:hypothetical protein